MAAILRLLDAAHGVARVLEKGRKADCVDAWRAIEELRDARQCAEAMLRDFQELADCALDALDSPMGSIPPVSRVIECESVEAVASGSRR